MFLWNLYSWWLIVCRIINSSPHKCHIYASVNWVSIGSDIGLALNKCSLIASWTLRYKLQWNSNKNTKLCIPENAFENVFYEMVATFYWGRWAKGFELKMAIEYIVFCICVLTGPLLVQIIVCQHFGAEQLSKPMLLYYLIGPTEQCPMWIISNFICIN